MATFPEDFPKKKDCRIEIRRKPLSVSTNWILLVDNRDNKVIFCNSVRADLKIVYEDCLFAMNNSLVIESWMPDYCGFEFKKFDNIDYFN